LADHIAIVYKGKLVCEGPGTSLKARFGDSYLIRSSDDSTSESMIWRTSNSAEATRKLLELESLDNDNTYDVVFPTLEQVFLKVTSDTAIHAHGGDGFVGEQETSTVIDEKIFALETENARDIDLDVGHGIGLARQVQALFTKRYILLLQKPGWIAYSINLIIPIIVAAALVKFLYKFHSIQTCEMNVDALRNPAAWGANNVDLDFPVLETYSAPSFYSYEGEATGLVGPESAWSGRTQDALYISALGDISQGTTYATYVDGIYVPAPVNQTAIDELALSSRQFQPDINGIVTQITNYSGSGYSGFGIFAPTPEAATLFYSSENAIYSASKYSQVFNLITNRITNASTSTGTAREVTTSLRSMRHPTNTVDFRNLPITALIILAFICATSIAAIYPAYERINNVRALHYCNGVSPAALWLGYLLFDTQVILIQSIIVWGMLYAGPLARLYYASNYLLGVFILFGIATYLGTYLLSLFIKKAAFAIASGIHIVLFVLYLVGYIVNQAAGDPSTMHQTYTNLQIGLGLSSPAANLARALWIATNTFEILCGKYGDNDLSKPFSYDRYGSPYANLIIQILFLVAVLGIYEYGSGDWIRRNITHRGVPARLHYIVESGDAPTAQPTEAEKNARATTNTSSEILAVSRISKFFGKIFAVENVSFNISSNETLALLGGNGAGKTTVINMIRGELKPNFGDIFLDGTSVLRNPHKARLHMGVCPQDDAIDNLTVRQTLNFYATVKGLKNVIGNVDKVLNALNISSYQDLTVKALSGGTRRKLSVAIALLGKITLNLIPLSYSSPSLSEREGIRD
jgi:ATP-binding cassette, subfamily A (ABC1), member 3